jgi:hypothetical protein
MLLVLELGCRFLRFMGLLSNETEEKEAAQAYHSFIQLTRSAEISAFRRIRILPPNLRAAARVT